MIRLPRSYIGTAGGALVGLTLGPPGVVAGAICGMLLDRIISEMRARAAIRRALCPPEGGSRPAGGNRRRDIRRLLEFPVIAAAKLVRHDRRHLCVDGGDVEWLWVVAGALRVTGGLPANAGLRRQVGAHLTAVNDSRVTVGNTVTELVRLESSGLSIEDIVNGLRGVAGQEAFDRHLAFLDSLRPNGAPSIRDTANGELVWDPEASHALGLSGPASREDIRRAFRERAQQIHPDRDGGTGAEFVALRDAYERLISRNDERFAGRDSEDDRRDSRSRAQSDTRY